MIPGTTLTEAQLEQLQQCSALESVSFGQRNAIRSARLSIGSHPDSKTDVRHRRERKALDALKPEAAP
jgi:hypothetical protein